MHRRSWQKSRPMVNRHNVPHRQGLPLPVWTCVLRQTAGAACVYPSS
jgi:hypothetical protein